MRSVLDSDWETAIARRQRAWRAKWTMFAKKLAAPSAREL
jgi:hypothetical protein